MTSIKIASQPQQYRTANSQSDKQPKPATPGISAGNQETNSNSPSSSVAISGRAMLLSRLFHTENPNADPKVATSTTTANMSGSVYSFLTHEDRKTLSNLYEYAVANNIDPAKVDGVAFDLAHYRMAGPGGPLDSTGTLFDTNGNPLINTFEPADEAVAQRVLTSKAIKDTGLDHGFLSAVFNPGKTPVHASDFAFLEKAVYAFSRSGSDGATDPNAAPVVRPKKEDFAPFKLDAQASQSAHDILLARLFPGGLDNNTPTTPLDSYKLTSNFADFLNASDKDMLGKLYASTQAQQGDLSKVDQIAILIGNYRMMSGLF